MAKNSLALFFCRQCISIKFIACVDGKTAAADREHTFSTNLADGFVLTQGRF